MKKRRTAVLSMLLCMTLISACGAKSAAPAASSEAAAPAAAVEETGDKNGGEDLPEVVEEPTDEQIVEEIITSSNELIGYHGETVYTNTFFDLQWTLPANWMFATNEEANGVDVFSEDEMIQRIQSGQEYYDMFAQHPDTGSNVIVMIQGLSGVGALASLIDMETIIDESIAPSVQSLEAQGATDVAALRETVLFRGEEVPCLTLTCHLGNMEVYQRVVYILRDDYLAAISVTQLGDADTASKLALFTRIP